MKENTPEQQLDLLCSQIIRERDHWNYINENGCNDPFWPDGSNINLTRNHIISYKRDIAELCEKTGMPLPEEYFLKVPPEVDMNYMANLKQKARVERLKQQGNELSRKNQKRYYQTLQLCAVADPGSTDPAGWKYQPLAVRNVLDLCTCDDLGVCAERASEKINRGRNARPDLCERKVWKVRKN